MTMPHPCGSEIYFVDCDQEHYNANGNFKVRDLTFIDYF